MTASIPVCTVYLNNSYTGNCPTNPLLRSYFAISPTFYYYIAIAAGMAFIFGALFIMTKYRQKGLGRFLEGWTGTIGFTLDGQVGKIRPIGKGLSESEGVAFFDGGKGRMQAPIIISPDSQVPLTASYGGMKVMLVDTHKRTSLPPLALEWAEEQFAEFAKTHDWPHFCYAYKLRQFEHIRELKEKYVQVTDPANQIVTLIEGDPATEVQKPYAKLTEAEKKWYDGRLQYVASLPPLDEQYEAKLRAAYRGDKSYVFGKDSKGKPIRHEITPLEKVEMVQEVTREIRSAQGSIADSIFHGRTIPAQYVANVLMGIPTIQYLVSIMGDIEKAILSKLKNSWVQYIPLAAITGIMIGAIVLVGFILK